MWKLTLGYGGYNKLVKTRELASPKVVVVSSSSFLKKQSKAKQSKAKLADEL